MQHTILSSQERIVNVFYRVIYRFIYDIVDHVFKRKSNPRIARLVKIEARDPYNLWVEFDDGARGLVNMSVGDDGIPTVWQTEEGWLDVALQDGVPVWSGWYDACPLAIWYGLTGKNR